MKKLYITLCLVILSACSATKMPEQQNTEPVSSNKNLIEIQDNMTAFSGNYSEIDLENSAVAFEGKSSIVSHPSYFEKFTANLQLDETNPANLENAALSVEIDISSVQTDSEGMRKHYLREDFFDLENYPEASFISKKFTKKENNKYLLSGVLNIKGTSKDIEADAEIDDEKIIVNYDIPRKEFGVANDTYGQKLMADLIPLNVMLKFKK